jgi:hypothetical protein
MNQVEALVNNYTPKEFQRTLMVDSLDQQDTQEQQDTQNGQEQRDDVVARVRAELAAAGKLPPDFDAETARAYEVAVDWERYVNAVADRAIIDEAVRAFRASWPALVRWRTRVLEAKGSKKARPAEIAAAWECVALECLLAGELHLADEARSAAVRVMTERAMDRRG